MGGVFINFNSSLLSPELIDEIVQEVIVKVKNLLKPPVIVFGPKSNDILSRFNVIELENYTGCEKIFITDFSIKMLSALASLNCSCADEQFILNHILNGKEVYIIKDNASFQTFPKEVYKKCLQLEKTLKNYNVKFVKDISQIANFKQTKLISLNNINQFIVDNKVIINKNMIVTPLAKDYITEQKLILERR